MALQNNSKPLPNGDFVIRTESGENVAIVWGERTAVLMAQVYANVNEIRLVVETPTHFITIYPASEGEYIGRDKVQKTGK